MSERTFTAVCIVVICALAWLAGGMAVETFKLDRAWQLPLAVGFVCLALLGGLWTVLKEDEDCK